jgi:hypothetical protein
MEIERKFLLSKLPTSITPYQQSIVYEFYLTTEPTVRLSERTDSDTGLRDYKMTVKGDGQLSRFESEIPITEKFFKDVTNCFAHILIKKNYLKYFLEDNHTLEISIVDNGVFVYGEVEFKTEEEANAFEFPYPEIVIKEITYNDKYRMKNYWLNKKEHGNETY